MKFDCDICVIGSGAIGKASALALAQTGLTVTLLAPESSAPALGEHWDMRVYALNASSRTLLSSLKVWEAMQPDRIAPVSAMAIYGDAESRAGHLHFDAYGARADALAWIVEDANLNQALDAALRFAAGVTRVAQTATQLQVDAEAATVSLANGASLVCRLVVGADGADSWVRSRADIGMDYRAYGERAVVANFSCERPHHGVASQWFLGGNGIVALLPLAGERVSLVWSAPEVLAEQLLSEGAEALSQRLQHLPEFSLGQLAMLAPAVPKAYPLRLIRAHAMLAHRVALVGDAAHVIHPLAGQGLNLGFADIDALCHALSQRDSAADCGEQRGLARYARARKEAVLTMQLATDGLQRLFASEFGPLKLLRNLGMTWVDKLPFLKRHLITQALGQPTPLSSGKK